MKVSSKLEPWYLGEFCLKSSIIRISIEGAIERLSLRLESVVSAPASSSLIGGLTVVLVVLSLATSSISTVVCPHVATASVACSSILLVNLLLAPLSPVAVALVAACISKPTQVWVIAIATC